MKRILAIVFAAVLALSVVGCAEKKTSGSDGDASGAATKLEKIQNDKKIVVYTDPNFSPFEFHANGTEVVGVDIEIAKAIAQELGVEIEIKEADFDAIIMAIASGKGDIAISGFTITEDRKKEIDFSSPYINSVQYIIVPADSSIAVVEDLAGKKVGVAKGYTGQFLMQDETSKDEETGDEGVLYNKNTTVTDYRSANEATLALKSGKIGAVVMDEFVAKKIVDKNSGLKAIELKYQDGSTAAEEYGVVVPKGNQDLLEKINAVIDTLKSEGKIEGWVVQFSEME